MSGIEWGSIAELSGGLASIVAAMISIFALVSAQRANDEVRRFNEQAMERERKRELLESAGTLQVWWAREKGVCDGKEVDHIGLIISNEGSIPTVFRNLRISYLQDGKRGVMKEIAIVVPGRHFYPSTTANRAWAENEEIAYRPKRKNDWLHPVESCYAYIPFLEAKKYVIIKLEYLDHIGRRWVWTPEYGLTEV